MPWTPLVKLRCSDPHQGSCTHQHHQLEMQAGRGGRSEGAARRKGKNGMRLRRERLPMSVHPPPTRRRRHRPQAEQARLIVSHICQIFFLWNIISHRTHSVKTIIMELILVYGSIFNHEDMVDDFGVDGRICCQKRQMALG